MNEKVLDFLTAFGGSLKEIGQAAFEARVRYELASAQGEMYFAWAAVFAAVCCFIVFIIGLLKEEYDLCGGGLFFGGIALLVASFTGWGAYATMKAPDGAVVKQLITAVGNK